MPITINGSGPITGADGLLTQGTAVASTSGTSIDFTGISSWVKRVTVMFAGVSTSGSAVKLVRLGTSSGVKSTGYNATGTSFPSGSSPVNTSENAGFILYSGAAADIVSGHLVITSLGSNIWVASGVMKNATNYTLLSAGDVTLSGTLDRIRIIAANGTDTFDAGSINIMYE